VTAVVGVVLHLSVLDRCRCCMVSFVGVALYLSVLDCMSIVFESVLHCCRCCIVNYCRCCVVMYMNCRCCIGVGVAALIIVDVVLGRI
jgi:hypothetical protein